MGNSNIASACAFEKEKSCAALNEKKCDGCKFRKTKEELREGRQKVVQRLKRLGIYEQMRKVYKNIE